MVVIFPVPVGKLIFPVVEEGTKDDVGARCSVGSTCKDFELVEEESSLASLVS